MLGLRIFTALTLLSVNGGLYRHAGTQLIFRTSYDMAS